MNREIFEGKDYPTQWALNPSMYQNMSNDQVDWAALAQQWIKMKETVVPPAPPPPSLSNESSNDGGGEAPMDMDTKDDDVPPAPPAPNISGADGWNQWSQWGSWNASAPGGACWEWSGVPPPGVIMGPDGKPMGLPSTVPAISPAASIPSRSGSHSAHSASPYSYNSVSPVQPAFNSTMPGYWSADTTQNPTPFAKGMRHSSRISHVRGDMIRSRDDKEKTPEEDTTTVLDAAKRRQLPAWIREGLEKMEREKHKAVERERQEMLRKQELIARKLAEDEARAVLNPAKSKFDSDSEKEAEEDSDIPSHAEDRNNADTSPDILLKPRRSRFRDAGSPDARASGIKEVSPHSSPVNTHPPVKRSREEILQDVMLKVRRSLTEILLEVTNEEIGNVCREVWERSRAKAPAGGTPTASLTNTAPLAQITRKLGLGIYGDSNSESEEEQENNQTDDDDSDAELKETLRRRQVAFKKTEEEIEARLLEEEENEIRETEESNNHENDTGNDTTNDQVEEKDLSNERELSEGQSSPGTPPKPADTREVHKSRSHSSPSRSQDSESSSSTPSSSSTDTPSSDSSRSVKKRRKKKSKSPSPSRCRKSRSRSHSRDRRHRDYRSRSSSRKSKRSRERKRKSREERSRSRSRRRSRSYSRRHSRHSRSRSRNRKHYSHSSSSKRRTRSNSKERRRSRSRSRGFRDGKKSSRRYRD